MKHQTIQRVATPTAILIGLPDALAGRCLDILDEGGLRVLRVGHVAAASERIPIVMPQLVVLGSAVRQEELEMLNDRCVAVGANVMSFPDDVAPEALTAALKKAARLALLKALAAG